MKLCTLSADSRNKLVEKANEKNIQKEQVVNMIQEKDGTFTLTYFEED
jgi:hypothetical protein